MRFVPNDELNPTLVRAAAADQPAHIQNRLARSVEYYFRQRMNASRGASLFALCAVTFSDGVRQYQIVDTLSGWTVIPGGDRRGAHGVGPHEAARIPFIYDAFHRDLQTLRAQLRQLPIKTNKSIRGANRQLRDLLADFSYVFRDVSVVSAAGELVLAVRRGPITRTLTPEVRWGTFCTGSFAPAAVAIDRRRTFFNSRPATSRKYWLGIARNPDFLHYPIERA